MFIIFHIHWQSFRKKSNIQFSITLHFITVLCCLAESCALIFCFSCLNLISLSVTWPQIHYKRHSLVNRKKVRSDKAELQLLCGQITTRENWRNEESLITSSLLLWGSVKPPDQSPHVHSKICLLKETSLRLRLGLVSMHQKCDLTPEKGKFIGLS